MPAGIGRGHGEGGVGLFGKTHLKLNGLASVIEYATPPVDYEGKLGINEVAIITRQVLNGLLIGFLISGKAMIRSRLGTKPDSFNDTKSVVNNDTSNLLSSTPRP